MTATPPRRIEIAAPAKLNLGLEIVAKRPDGYHDLATVFLTVDLCDRLVVSREAETTSRGVEQSRGRGAEGSKLGPGKAPLPAHRETPPSGGGGLGGERGRGEGLRPGGDIPESTLTFSCSDPTLATEENLALSALETLKRETGYPGGAYLELTKRIPTAAGLGGASSDAAAALIAGNALWHLGLPAARLGQIAARLGSDVPFLLRGGCTLGRGRGDLLDALPLPNGIWFVLVMPRLVIPRKTARLYALLTSGDFSDGARVTAQGDRLRASLPLDPALLGNAFARPLTTLAPDLAELPAILLSLGAPHVALSGAGPTHYIPLSDPAEAGFLATAIRERLGPLADVAVASPVAERSIMSLSNWRTCGEQLAWSECQHEDS